LCFGGFDEEGSSAFLVIPLPENVVLPKNAIYRQYTSKQGWFTFVENSKNTISSALINEQETVLMAILLHIMGD